MAKLLCFHFELQMHGYDMHGPPDLSHHVGGGAMDLGGVGHAPNGLLPLAGTGHHGHHGHPGHPGHGLHPSHQGHAPLSLAPIHDPSDAFVQFLDSDDSMQHDTQSP